MPDNTSLSLEQELKALLNRHSAEGRSNTPDFILAEFMVECLGIWHRATRKRDKWWGVDHKVGGTV